MGNDDEPYELPEPEKVRELLALMGVGLVAWQNVEDEH